MKVAVEGCCHGQLDAIYRHIQSLQSKVDLLLICGDFQATRNNYDLESMSVPPKYKAMADFHKYYTGQATAPVLTVVIGGNHEASNHLWELYHGGWLAPNIYFLGHAGCVQVNGIRIAGASGIFKQQDFHRGHFEKQPYDKSTMRSIYHIREYNVRRLSLLSSPDVFLSHDWPCGIEQHGDLNGLLRRKPFLRGDITSKQLGSPPLMGLLRNLQPTWWFAAHLHTRFEARVRHDPAPETTATTTTTSPPSSLSSLRSGPLPRADNPDEIMIDDDAVDDAGTFDAPSGGAASVQVQTIAPRALQQNPDEIALDDEIDAVEPPPPPPPPTRETRFLALDKCLPHRQFLEVVDIPTLHEQVVQEGDDADAVVLCYDPEWLAITRAFQPYLSREHKQAAYPSPDDARAAVSREWDWVHAHVPPKLNLRAGAGAGADDDGAAWRVDACQRFVVRTPPPPPAGGGGASSVGHPDREGNTAAAMAQTEAFAALLEMENVVAR